MLLHCKSPIKETVAQTAEALFTRAGTILAELSFFVEACDVCGSVVSSNKENIIQAIRGRKRLGFKVGRTELLFYLAFPENRTVSAHTLTRFFFRVAFYSG